MKNSFILYSEHYEYIEELDINQRGLLLTAIFEYENNKKISVELDQVTKIIFKVIKTALDSNAEKYEKKVEVLRTNSSKKSKSEQIEPDKNQIDSVYVNVDVDVNDNVNESDNVSKNDNPLTADTTDTTDTFIVTTVFTPKDKYLLTQKQLEEFERDYPDVDILKDFEKIKNEINNMPKCNLKGKNLSDFIIRWLGRTQMTGGNKHHTRDRPNHNQNAPDIDDIFQKAVRKGMKMGEFA